MVQRVKVRMKVRMMPRPWDLLTRGARTGQARSEATGEVPVTGRAAAPVLPGQGSGVSQGW